MILIGYNLFGFCDVACYANIEPQTGRDTVGLKPGRGCLRLEQPASAEGGQRVNNDRLYGHGARVTPAPVQGRAAVGFLSPFGQSSGHF